ncbi:hypothetical protein Scep_006746 [Stephania cephalantha]|uniref:BED-type domain-containing protein n=1 Tax=Stephania cephalantha TaxID=152367 RepID=A0AAP0KA45_9MAGN
MDSHHVTAGTLSTDASSTPMEFESGGPIVAPPNSSSLPSSTKKAESKGNRTTSKVWDHYSKTLDEHGKVTLATCNYCGKEYHCPSKNGTSTITSHLNKCPKYPHSQVNSRCKKQKTIELQVKGSEDESKIGLWKFDQTLSREALTELIIGAELPFVFVEHPCFVKFCNVIQPKLKLVKRRTITRDCLEMYNVEKAKLKKILTKNSQRVCLTTDTWTSLQNTSYMCLTAHYVDDDWKLQKKIINFCEIEGHTADDIGKAVEMCLLHWKIEKVFTITVDNVKSNDLAIEYLRRQINNWGGSVLNAKYLHVRCCGHILNLIVSDGLKEVKESISRIREAS